MSHSQPKSERSKPEPKALTPEYHKARKQLMLWAGILLIWALVGVDLTKAEATGGSIGAIITAIKSPQAVPWVLVILVGYFLFKTTIEWYQCSLSRRTLRVSRIDFISAWVVSVVACGLYFGQIVIKVRLADVFTFSTSVSMLLGGIVASWHYGSVERVSKLRKQGKLTMGHFVLILTLAILIPALFVTASYLLASLFQLSIHWRFMLAGWLLGSIFYSGVFMIGRAEFDWSIPDAPKPKGEL